MRLPVVILLGWVLLALLGQLPWLDPHGISLPVILHPPSTSHWLGTDDLGREVLDRLLSGVDIAYLDGTFYDGSELPGRDLAEIPHPAMVTTMELLASRARRSPGSLRFIHLNHSNPALTDPAVRRDVEVRGFRIASTGARLRL